MFTHTRVEVNIIKHTVQKNLPIQYTITAITMYRSYNVHIFLLAQKNYHDIVVTRNTLLINNINVTYFNKQIRM